MIFSIFSILFVHEIHARALSIEPIRVERLWLGGSQGKGKGKAKGKVKGKFAKRKKLKKEAQDHHSEVLGLFKWNYFLPNFDMSGKELQYTNNGLHFLQSALPAAFHGFKDAIEARSPPRNQNDVCLRPQAKEKDRLAN